jgi:hypothetical protein
MLFAIGAALGGLIASLIMMQQLRAARSRAARRTERLIKLTHDIRGAVTPALLMAERLGLNSDPGIREAAGVVADAMERTAELAKAASSEARVGSVAQPARDGS